MAVQVAIDDSNRGQENAPAFILAGYVGTAERWCDFADAWQRELDREPSLKSPLKASDAINLKRNFADWSDEERDQRLVALAKIIRKHAFASVHCSLVKDDFDRIFKGFNGSLKKLYPQASISLVTRVMHFAEKRKSRQTWEYIFDENILSPNQLRNLHRDALKHYPQKEHLMKKFRHDTDTNFYPLQAADLFAGYYREKLVTESEGRVFKSKVFDALAISPCIDATVGEHQMDYIRRGVLEWNLSHSSSLSAR